MREEKRRKKSRCAVNERKESQVKVITRHYYNNKAMLPLKLTLAIIFELNGA
jgi:hypothetical protein